MMLLWNNASIHRSDEVKWYFYTMRQKLETRRFLAYAPELNSDEYLFSHIKCKEMANFCPSSEVEMKLRLRKAIAHAIRKSELIKHILPGPPLFEGKY